MIHSCGKWTYEPLEETVGARYIKHMPLGRPTRPGPPSTAMKLRPLTSVQSCPAFGMVPNFDPPGTSFRAETADAA